MGQPALTHVALDTERLTAWLDDQLPWLGAGPLGLTRLSGGSSSIVYRLDRGGPSAVLRVPADPPRADSLSAMAREARVLRALAGTKVPHPRLLADAADSAAIGKPFMLMEFVDGWLGSAPAPAPFDCPGKQRDDLAFAMVEAVARLAEVDYAERGLSDLGKPAGFLERQVDRWLSHIESYKKTENHPGRDIPGLHYVAQWLRANMPVMQRVSIIHSDVGFPNVMFAHGAPARVAAIIDWEIATLGDPLLDLGRAVFAFPGRKVGHGVNPFTDLSTYPTREALAERYAEVSGLSVAHLDYYVVLAMFKLAAILEFNYARMVNSKVSSGLEAKISDYVLQLIREAEVVARAAG